MKSSVLLLAAMGILSGCCTRAAGGLTGGENTIPDVNAKSPLADVHFSFDSSKLDATAKDLLGKNAEWLKANMDKKVVVEGHCDERGTAEYNMALGERRASTAKEYLVRLGVASSRLETVSFGEERPFDTGKGESAWAKNRRAHFVMKK